MKRFVTTAAVRYKMCESEFKYSELYRRSSEYQEVYIFKNYLQPN